MDFERESNRLFQVYDEKSNDELLALQGNREDLTEVAQDALARVIRGRGLIAVEAEAEAPGVEAAADGGALLWAFDDMFQANRAIQLLEEVQVRYWLVDLSKGGTVAQRYPWLQLMVEEQDFGAARKLLQQGMGLFPEAEVEAPHPDAGLLDDLVGVLIFDAETEMSDGLAAAAALAKAGVTFVWHDGRDWPEGLADAMTVAIEVRQESYERAQAIVEACLA